MKVAVGVILLLTVIGNASVLKRGSVGEEGEIIPAGVANFTLGLMKGLETHPDKPDSCTSSLDSAHTLINHIAQDIKSIFGGDTKALNTLVNDIDVLISYLESISDDCNFNGLAAELESLGTSAGRKQVLVNLYSNLGQIISDAKDMARCPHALYDCGFDIGEIFRLLLGWGI